MAVTSTSGRPEPGSRVVNVVPLAAKASAPPIRPGTGFSVNSSATSGSSSVASAVGMLGFSPQVVGGVEKDKQFYAPAMAGARGQIGAFWKLSRFLCQRNISAEWSKNLNSRHSERSEESSLGRDSGKILRCAQNDRCVVLQTAKQLRVSKNGTVPFHGTIASLCTKLRTGPISVTLLPSQMRPVFWQAQAENGTVTWPHEPGNCLAV